MKYYIATKLENHFQHNRLRDALNALGHQITYDWTTHGPVYSKGLEVLRQTAVAETKGVMDADILIMLWPGGRGTHVELGMAIAAGKHVVLVSDIEAHHGATTETCAFYHYPLVRMCHNIEDAIGLIMEVEIIPKMGIQRSERLLADRISQYLQVGGLFNPEQMDHDKVRDLLIDCRNHLEYQVNDAARLTP